MIMNQNKTESKATPGNGAIANNDDNHDKSNHNVQESILLLRKLSSIHIEQSSYEPPPTSTSIETVMGNHQSNSISSQSDYDVERGTRTSSSSSSTSLSSSLSSESNPYHYDPNKDYFFHDSKRYSTTQPNKITNKNKPLQHSYTKPPKKNNKKVSSIDDLIYNHEEQQYYSLEELVDHNIYVVKQKVGYLALGYSLIQTVILIAMMMKCGIAPLNINPTIGPYPDALDYWGAKNTAKILDDHEWWRFITPLFLHGGIIHLFCNIFVQMDIGAFFEREWGSLIWFIVYMASGIGSSIFSCIFSPNNISVGSSGAVMGLFGGKLAEIFCRACESHETTAAKISREVRKEQLHHSLCSVTLVLLFSFVPYIDWAAHCGGLISGFTTGMICFAPWIKTKGFAFFWFVFGLALNIIFYGVTLTYLFSNVNPSGELKDVCGYYKQFFEDYECNCQID